ncbi:hypothetical protein jhhlp_006693 [Lomentospora prolificans]|uniref:Uncharacterized protein n=1 Tax=Lomentospora prolificans TaxID=41688 RepID=A0A2N3N6M3_9PEZI|nr:hypothetical protein jhhlp_006103 [Lomentospora prolificans]PKS08081.1 hypothetical protein jhhlp_006693 [Lomentospora prolificans]
MDQPEQLLDAFKAAALSVTKLYKTSVAAQTKARQEGYQDCLEELLAFLDKENIGLGDGEGWRIRRWATERLAGATEAMVQDRESEDEAEKNERCSIPEITRSNSSSQLNSIAERAQSVPVGGANPSPKSEESSTTTMTDSTATVTPPSPAAIAVPTQDQFTFQSTMSYPDAPNLATLNLSDSHPHSSPASSNTSHSTRQPRARHNLGRPSSRTSAALGRGAGQKRKINFAEIFDLGSLGNGKDMFGGGKRSRHL